MASYRMDIAAVPDIRLDALSTIGDGPNVSTELRITGTHTGPTVLGEFGRALVGTDADELPASATSSASWRAGSDRTGGMVVSVLRRAAGENVPLALRIPRPL
jgi:hypothetical protein